MILIDTNVISELVKPQPSANVQAWFNTQVPADTCISAITVMEMLEGVGRLPMGAKRTRIDQLVNAIIPRFACLPFDEFAARSYAQLTKSPGVSATPSQLPMARSPPSLTPMPSEPWPRATRARSSRWAWRLSIRSSEAMVRIVLVAGSTTAAGIIQTAKAGGYRCGGRGSGQTSRTEALERKNH